MTSNLLAFTSAAELMRQWDQSITIKDFCSLLLVVGIPLLILGLGLLALKLLFLDPLLTSLKIFKGDEGKGFSNFCSSVGHLGVSLVSLLVIGTLLYSWFCPTCKPATKLRGLVGLSPYKAKPAKTAGAKTPDKKPTKPKDPKSAGKAKDCCDPQKPAGTKVVVAHPVCRGETLWQIARRYGTSVEYLMWRNGIKNPHLIYEGELIALVD